MNLHAAIPVLSVMSLHHVLLAQQQQDNGGAGEENSSDQVAVLADPLLEAGLFGLCRQAIQKRGRVRVVPELVHGKLGLTIEAERSACRDGKSARGAGMNGTIRMRVD